MKNFVALFILGVILLSLVPTDAEAQRFTKRRRYASIGVNLNAMNYFGDIVPEADFTSLRVKSTRPNIGIEYTYRMYPRFSVRGNMFWGRITGDDRKSASQNEEENIPRYKRNLNFRNDIKELSGTMIFDLYENRGAYTRRPDFTPYAFVGVALFHHNPKAYHDGGQDLAEGYYELQPLGTEGQQVGGNGYASPYKKIQIAIPAGIGFRYKLDRLWDLSFEIGWRKTFTDYLDDVSGQYASKADLLSMGGEKGKAAAILSDRSGQSGFPGAMADPSGTPYSHLPGYGVKGEQRGDVTDDDWYIITGLHLTYIMPVRTRGPKFR
ncbi:hypothetical protein AAE02nite_06790 [Adhaeribacter aerolatus]|uniref:DUF6089 domain-containing protein n=1 Tax=Adhaeribacter aerolatus TaxID=670289 RepID=A0A512ATG9_9BACT|nr:DUF6089 family protein [Adhaeribacter aerolatus]GEO03015.1 hypothetical protein AAE02nite_06790 [Adhaeribacter aerolatus]